MATMNSVIEYVDNILPNVYKEDDKYEWMKWLDGRIAQEVMHIEAPTYDLPDFADSELLVGHPYDDIYHLYVMSKIHFYNQEYDLYNNVVLMFKERFDAFAAWYLRTHGSGSKGRTYRNILG